MRPRGVLLDIDGTFLDSNDAHAAAYVEALAAEGLRVPFARIRPLIGMGSDKLLPAIGVDPASPAAQHVERAKKDLFDRRHLPTLAPCRGARDLLLVLKKRDLTLSVATSAAADELHGLLRAAHIADLVDVEATSSDASASKPDPDIVEAAIARAKLPPSALVMIGDTRYDVEAAHRAGVRIIALRAGGSSDEDLRAAEQIFDDPADLLARYDESLLGG
ncbi:MAG TPA: HAD family hydrolase [Polyangiaceae bacterium]|jgi:HAD superfamily hydrolase (TIGR01509 family)